MNRHRGTNVLALFCALTSVFLIFYGCGGGDDGGGGSPVAVTYSISGTVVSSGPLADVTMTLGGAGTATVITDASGNYTFTGLDNGIYTITPSATGFTFSPASSLQIVAGADIAAVNFTAAPEQTVTYSISGTVASSGPLSGVTMTLSGASTAAVITDASGSYTFTGLDNGSYTITPSRTGFTFSPASSLQTVSGADIAAVNFTAAPEQAVTYSISGNVMWNGPTPIPGVFGVAVTLSGASSATAITGPLGDYAFTGLDNGSYTITPSETGLVFGPASSTRTVSGADIPGVNFFAFVLPIPQVVTCPPTGTTNVTIQDFSFTPSNAVISANGIVKWTNNGTTHTVTSGTATVPIGIFDTGNIATGDTACIQFPNRGIFVYSCTIHPDMIGIVVVQ